MWNALCHAQIVAAALSLASLATAAPPRVVETLPAHGEAGVDPDRVTRLTVTFDQPMAVGSHSWVGGGPLFPELAGDPAWLDDRTAVLPVALEPERDYQLGVNGGRFMNFRNAAGEPAEPTPLIFSTRAWPMSDEDRAEAVRLLRDILARRYSYRDRLGIDWNAAIDNAQAELLSAESALEFAIHAAALLDAAEDPHIAVRLGPLTAPSDWRARRAARRDLRPNFNGRTVSRIVRDFSDHGAGVVSGVIAPGVGYVLIPAWPLDAGEAGRKAMTRLFERNAADHLVIDVRPNAGGNEIAAKTLAEAFIDKPTRYAVRRYVNPGAESGFTQDVPAEILPTPIRGVAPKRIAVLIGPTVMSSCEAFCLMMRAAGATLIGEPTLGSSGNPSTHRLPGGLTIAAPSWIAMDAEGQPFEGVGIAPDITVETDPDDLTDDDPVLRRAIEFLGAPWDGAQP